MLIVIRQLVAFVYMSYDIAIVIKDVRIKLLFGSVCMDKVLADQTFFGIVHVADAFSSCICGSVFQSVFIAVGYFLYCFSGNCHLVLVAIDVIGVAVVHAISADIFDLFSVVGVDDIIIFSIHLPYDAGHLICVWIVFI